MRHRQLRRVLDPILVLVEHAFVAGRVQRDNDAQRCPQKDRLNPQDPARRDTH